MQTTIILAISVTIDLVILKKMKIVADVHYLADFNTRVVCETVNFLKNCSRGINKELLFNHEMNGVINNVSCMVKMIETIDVYQIYV